MRFTWGEEGVGDGRGLGDRRAAMSKEYTGKKTEGMGPK